MQNEFKIMDEGDFIVQVKNPSDKSSFVQHNEMPNESIKKLFAGIHSAGAIGLYEAVSQFL